MGKIKQLSPLEAQKIAAGEVVERPANIVKELLENALDAGATAISLYVKDGGKKSIRIVDNGCGMPSDDARACFLHHATSKITSVDQLNTIQTFGFRGEALSSIAAVSKVRLLTRDESSQMGTLLHLEASQIINEDQQPCNRGTDITVENLFFNVPARYKFLKTRDTEWRQILLLFHAMAISYPAVHFTVEHDDTLIHNCPAAKSLQERIAQLYERHGSQHMIMLENGQSVGVSGMISNHQYYKYDRSHVFVFVNKRWVKNFKIVSALIKGYSNVLPEGKYPVAALFIDIAQDEIDVNVHPRKEEVQFLHPRIIEQSVTQVVKEALELNLSKQLQVRFDPMPQRAMQHAFSQPSVKQLYPDFSTAHHYYERMQKVSVVDSTKDVAHHDLSSPDLPDVQQKLQQQPFNEPMHQTTIDQQESGVLIGQYNKTYLLIEKEDGLYIIDQHAAHERIMYEQFSNKKAPVEAVSLLFPQTITLSCEQLDILERHFALLHACAIAIERFGSDTCIIHALPVYLKAVDCSAIITDLLHHITQHASLNEQEFNERIMHALYAQMACKAAVKAGDVLTHEQMHNLITTLATCNNRLTCPHGRPTGWLLPLYDIEKKFKRKL